VLGTQSILQSGSGVEKLIVGGIILFWMARQQATASMLEAAPMVCPSMDLIELTGMFFSGNNSRIAEDSSLSFAFVPVPCALI